MLSGIIDLKWNISGIRQMLNVFVVLAFNMHFFEWVQAQSNPFFVTRFFKRKFVEERGDMQMCLPGPQTFHLGWLEPKPNEIFSCGLVPSFTLVMLEYFLNNKILPDKTWFFFSLSVFLWNPTQIEFFYRLNKTSNQSLTASYFNYLSGIIVFSINN